MVLMWRSAIPRTPACSIASWTILSSSDEFPRRASWNGILPISTISLTVKAKLISLVWGTAATLRAMSFF